MKKNVLVVIFIIAAFMVATPPVFGDAAQDYKVIKNASKGKKGGELSFFKLTVFDKKAKKNNVKITLPLALIDLLAECDEDAKILDKTKTDLDLKKLMSILKKNGPMTLIEIEEDDQLIKIWLE